MKAHDRQYLHRWLWLGVLAILTAVIVGCGSSGAYRISAAGSYTTDELDAYGVWMTYPPYGRVWRPDVTSDWAPFYYGHWDYTSPDWTWVSYEPFGWIVYHYGSWLYTPEFGWVWVQGSGDWSPAVVEWMYYDDYVCWAPLPPRGVAWPQPWEPPPQGTTVWSVVHARDFTSENVGEHRVAASVARPDAQRVKIVNRYPDPKMIEQYTSQPVQSVKIDRQPVSVGKQQLHKMRLQENDQKRVEKFKPQVERHVNRRPGGHR